MAIYIFWRVIMIIDKINKDIINTKDVYIHDDIFLDLRFVRDKHRLCLLFATEDETSTYEINFIDVLGFEMTSCDFWGWSPHVYSFVSIKSEEYTIIPRLMENKFFDYAFESFAIDEYIETKIIFTSGDELIVACKAIEYNKVDTGDGSVC